MILKLRVVHMSLLFCFSRRRRHTRCSRDWSSDVCSSDLCGIPLEKPAQIGKAELANQYEKRLDIIRLENLSDPNIALVDLLFLILTLPPHIQDMLIPEIQQALLIMTIVNRNPSWQKEEKKE